MDNTNIPKNIHRFQTREKIEIVTFNPDNHWEIWFKFHSKNVSEKDIKDYVKLVRDKLIKTGYLLKIDPNDHIIIVSAGVKRFSDISKIERSMQNILNVYIKGKIDNHLGVECKAFII